MSVEISGLDKARYRKLLLQAMPVAIETIDENERALALVEELMSKDDALSTEEAALVRLLATLIQSFEEKHYKPEAATPVEVLRYLMEVRGVRQSDLWGLFGSKGIASEVVSGKRGISKTQARKLADFFKVSAELFI